MRVWTMVYPEVQGGVYQGVGSMATRVGRVYTRVYYTQHDTRVCYTQHDTRVHYPPWYGRRLPTMVRRCLPTMVRRREHPPWYGGGNTHHGTGEYTHHGTGEYTHHGTGEYTHPGTGGVYTTRVQEAYIPPGYLRVVYIPPGYLRVVYIPPGYREGSIYTTVIPLPEAGREAYTPVLPSP